MVFRAEGQPDRVAADGRGDGASDGWAGRAALAILNSFQFLCFKLSVRFPCAWPPPPCSQSNEWSDPETKDPWKWMVVSEIPWGSSRSYLINGFVAEKPQTGCNGIVRKVVSWLTFNGFIL